jgi:hypothetical protein
VSLRDGGTSDHNNSLMRFEILPKTFLFDKTEFLWPVVYIVHVKEAVADPRLAHKNLTKKSYNIPKTILILKIMVLTLRGKIYQEF